MIQESGKAWSADSTYDKLTPRLAKQLAAPHTWTASIMPAISGSVLAFCGASSSIGASVADSWAWVTAILCLIAAVLMQSAVNTINDYYDFVHGTDTTENSEADWDAVLVYNRLRPRSVYTLGLGFMALAAAMGVYPVFRGGMVVLITGIIGFAIIILYSAGPKPLSSLPCGEFFSGVVMGGGISVGTYFAMCDAGYFSMEDFGFISLMSVPHIIGIALIMLANNICDIERDRATKRHTLAVTLGRRRARVLYHCLCVIWLGCIAYVIWHFAGVYVSICLGAIILLSMISFYRIFTISRTPETRGLCMKLAVISNYCWNGVYILALVFI